MDVFGVALAAGGDLLRDAAIDAAFELGVLAGRCEPRTRRMRALLEYLAALGVVARDGGGFVPATTPPRPVVPRAGWGLMAEVIRRDRPLPVEGGATELRYHEHLVRVGRDAARELARLVDGRDVIDLGAGAGTYARAFLDDGARATVVDYPEVVALAKQHLARFGERVTFVAADIRGVEATGHDVALLANVLHLHPPAHCAQLVAAAARAVKPGGAVVIKDLRVDDGRAGPLEGLAFALNMAIYTGGGDVYETAQLRAWLAEAGLVGIAEHRLASQPDGIVLIGYRPRGAIATFEAIAGTAPDVGTDAMPRAFRTMLAHAAQVMPDVLPHYTQVMPAMRAAQLRESIFTMPLQWARLPRLRTVLDRWARIADAPSPRPPTLAALHETTHYGGFMPLLYGYPADLAYFTSRGLDAHATIDRYLPAPILHELCHFGRERDALLPPHLDECIAGWLGVHLWPELAYPAEGEDDAIYAAPWLSQVGQAVARAFGADNVIRAQSGELPWDVALPKRFVDEVTRFGWDDWCRRKTQHFLSDTLDPDPWIAIVRAYGAPPDADFDRQIVADALRAMCLASECVAGSFRTRTVLPAEPITIDGGWMRCGSLRYWVPLAGSHVVRLAAIADIERVAAELCAHHLPSTSP